MKKILFTLLTCCGMSPLFAQQKAPSPALPGAFADPHVAVFNGKYYIYPTTDGFEGWSSDYFTVWSSKDMKKWKKEGTILDFKKDLTWAKERAWAPAIAFKNNKYYFYFSADTNIGVAVADKPTGPFKDALGKPLITKGQYQAQVIDPMVFVDDDGQAYIYFGQGRCYIAKLNPDMISINEASISHVSDVQSTKTGVAPACETPQAVAINVSAGIITSSPLLRVAINRL